MESIPWPLSLLWCWDRHWCRCRCLAVPSLHPLAVFVRMAQPAAPIIRSDGLQHLPLSPPNLAWHSSNRISRPKTQILMPEFQGGCPPWLKGHLHLAY